MTLWDVAREERRRRRGEVGRHEKRKSIGLEFQDKYNTNRIKIRLENRREQECMKIDSGRTIVIIPKKERNGRKNEGGAGIGGSKMCESKTPILDE